MRCSVQERFYRQNLFPSSRWLTALYQVDSPTEPVSTQRLCEPCEGTTWRVEETKRQALRLLCCDWIPFPSGADLSTTRTDPSLALQSLASTVSLPSLFSLRALAQPMELLPTSLRSFVVPWTGGASLPPAGNPNALLGCHQGDKRSPELLEAPHFVDHVLTDLTVTV